MGIVDLSRLEGIVTVQGRGTAREGNAEMVYVEPNGAYYVFSAGVNGFVIIAGDDAYRPVIGREPGGR